MANELVIHHPTGATLYALLFDATGQIYNGSTFGAPSSASWTDYGIAMSEAATATGIYRADMPAVAAGAYGWVVRKQAGGSPAVGDIAVGAGSIRWTGTAEEAVPAAVNVTYWAGNASTSNELDAMNRLYDMIGTGLGQRYFNSMALQLVKNSIGLAAANLDTQLAAVALETTAQAILEDTGTTLPAQIGGLTVTVDPQDVADAMALATAETLEAGSVLAELAAIRNITDDLDVSAVSQAPVSAAGHLRMTTGITFAATISGLTIPADWVAAIWTVKLHPHQPDTAALLQLRRSQPGLQTDGLQRLNGVTPLVAADGVLTVDYGAGRVDIYLTDDVTALMAPAVGIGWDVKFIDSGGDSVGQRGTMDIALTETKALA